jgi:hypothetical protein
MCGRIFATGPFRTPALLYSTPAFSSPIQKPRNNFGKPLADSIQLCNFGHGCFAQTLDRSEVFKQYLLAIFADTWAIIQNAFRNSLLHQKLVVAVCKTMRFIPNPLEQLQST